MNETKTFKRYNFVTGTVDGTLAYNFGDAAYYPKTDDYGRMSRRKKARREEYAYEDDDFYDDAFYGDGSYGEDVAERRWSISPLTLIGSVCVIVILIMTLLAQIQMVNVSSSAAELEEQITQLNAEHDRLKAEYEAAFNLKSVEEYATNVLGMQEPAEDQIYYLTSVYPADKAVIITDESTGILPLGLEDLIASFKSTFQSYFD